MTFIEAIQSGFANYSNFNGRAARSEYWYFHLFVFLAFFVSLLLLHVFAGLLAIALFLPTLAVNVRRLHDIDKTGWLVLIAFVPIVGPLLLLYWHCLRGTFGDNQYGSDPVIVGR